MISAPPSRVLHYCLCILVIVFTPLSSEVEKVTLSPA
jgi:hypothetical protein